jgi:hypothetical protein
MAIDSEREYMLQKLQEELYKEFLKLVDDGSPLRREILEAHGELPDGFQFKVGEKDWRYFAVGIAMRFLEAAQISTRSELMGKDLAIVLAGAKVNTPRGVDGTET